MNFWREYLIACIFVSIGAFIIHIKHNSPPNFSAFFLWLPVTWVLTLTFAFGFILFLSKNN